MSQHICHSISDNSIFRINWQKLCLGTVVHIVTLLICIASRQDLVKPNPQNSNAIILLQAGLGFPKHKLHFQKYWINGPLSIASFQAPLPAVLLKRRPRSRPTCGSGCRWLCFRVGVDGWTGLWWAVGGFGGAGCSGEMAAQTVYGAAKMVLENPNVHPGVWVCLVVLCVYVCVRFVFVFVFVGERGWFDVVTGGRGW